MLTHDLFSSRICLSERVWILQLNKLNQVYLSFTTSVCKIAESIVSQNRVKKRYFALLRGLLVACPKNE